MPAIADSSLVPTALSATPATVTAAGTSASNATPITACATTVNTLVGNGAGVKLPAAQQGGGIYGPANGFGFGPQYLSIMNNGPLPCAVYATAGDDAPSMNSIPAGARYTFKAVSQGSWLCEKQVG
jgi:hypothetical protein